MLHDVAFRVHPITALDAHEMVRAIKGFRIFGFFALFVGLALIAAIVYSMLFTYR